MNQQSSNRVLLLACASALAACSKTPDRQVVQRTTRAVTSTNAFSQNALSTNALTHNAFSQNAFSQNGLTENAFSQNGLSQNAFSQNAFSQNAFSQNAFSQNQLLESDPNSVSFLKYAYSCAMPPGRTMSLQINGVEHTFEGSLGLAPEWDDVAAGGVGFCNESCQRWVSACILARTNAYGTTVDISLRAPRALFLAQDDKENYCRTHYLEVAPAPSNDFDNAYCGTTFVDLTPPGGGGADGGADGGVAEVVLYPKREGAYFGNVFQRSTRVDGASVNAPQYFACAGPNSNVPQITLRFCSSQAPACSIFTGDRNTWSTCTSDRPACALDLVPPSAGSAETGAVHDCQGFKEVITVYLKEPIAVCGNNICEGSVPGAIESTNGNPAEDENTCPSDCHPGTWAKSFDLNCQGLCALANAAGGYGPFLAVAHDGSIIRAIGATVSAFDWGPVDLGGGPLAGDTTLIAKYGPDGAFRWSVAAPEFARAVAVDPDGNIVVGGFDRLTKLSGAGALLWTFDNISDVEGPLAVDLQGNIFVMTFDGSGTTLAKFAPDGSPQWRTALPHPDPDALIARLTGFVRTDSQGAIIVSDIGNLYKVSAQGQVVWTKTARSLGENVRFDEVILDLDDNVVVAGSHFGSSADFGGGAISGGAYLAKYSGQDGSYLWARAFNGIAYPAALGLDQAGNLILAGGVEAFSNLGAGVLDTHGMADGFVGSYSASNGAFLWAKQIPLVTGGGIDSLALGQQGQIVLSGSFDGSMALDDHMLVNTRPERVDRQNLFLGVFTPPCSTPGCDVTPPLVGNLPAPGAPAGDPLVLRATGPSGTVAQFLPPTVVNAPDDLNFDGASVRCSPPSGSNFAIGTTTVTCAARDAHGNATSQSFTVTVLDDLGPTIANLHRVVTADATGSSGATVEFEPTAVDLVDGPVAVLCQPSSGALFPIGTTKVDCHASDNAGNRTNTSFSVVVDSTGDPTIVVPEVVLADATGPAGAEVHFDVTARDAFGGPLVPHCEPPSGSLFKLGTTIVACEVTDQAGRRATATFPVKVRYAWFGLLPPIKLDRTSFHLGSTIPVKFRLAPGITGAVANLRLAKVVDGVPGPTVDALSSGKANLGSLFRFDAASQEYIFNLSTRTLTAGVWQLQVDLHDGALHMGSITLR